MDRSSRTLLLLLCLPLSLAASSAFARDSAAPKVKTAHGVLPGVLLEDGVRVFRGVPYAQPPVGELRWREPAPVPHWKGVRRAERFGDRPMQPTIWKDMIFHSDKMSVSSTLPSNFSSWEEADTLALDLSQRELLCLTRAHFLGSWRDGSPDAPTLTYVSFFPNASYQPGLHPNLVMSAMQRAKWVAEQVFGDNWAETYTRTQAASRLIGQARKLS